MKRLPAYKQQPHNPSGVLRLLELVELLHATPLEADLWRAQNVFYGLLHSAYASAISRSSKAADSLAWSDMIARLGDQLGVRVDVAH